MLTSKTVKTKYRYTIGTSSPFFELIKEKLTANMEIPFSLEASAMFCELNGTPAIKHYNKDVFNYTINLISHTDLLLVYEVEFTEQEYYI